MPASRKAAATTAGPRQCPSRLGLTSKTFIRSVPFIARPPFVARSSTASKRQRGLPGPEGLAHELADLAGGHAGLYGAHHRRHDVAATLEHAAQLLHRRARFFTVALALELCDPTLCDLVHFLPRSRREHGRFVGL